MTTLCHHRVTTARPVVPAEGTSRLAVAGGEGAEHADASTRRSACAVPTRTPALGWCFLRWLGCSPVLADQALDGLPALDPGGHIDRLAGLLQRRSLLPRLVGSMIVVVLRVLGQDLPKVLFAVDQQVVEALAP